MNVAMSLDSLVDGLSLQGGILLLVILLLTRRHFSTPVRAEQAANISERPPPVRVTLRFCGIPNRIDEASFRKALSRPGDDSGIVGMSWTPSATSASHVATVCFAKDAPFLDKIWQKKNQIDCTIDLVSDGDSFDVSVDDHFLDLTPLYWPERWDIDIIAVTGWNGKPIWSWKPEDSRHVWLRDWLGRDLAERDCAARVFTYGYPSTVARSDSDASLRDYGANLLGSLATARRSEFEVRRSKPLILIGHSLGGLLIKQALKIAHASDDRSERDVYTSCAGLVMFGVPNLGLENRALISMTDGRKNEMLSRNLGLDSQYLPELNKDFALAFRQHRLRVISIYETKDSNTVQKEDGRWSRTGPPARMVPRHSACDYGGIPSEDIASFTNHSNLAKFPSQDHRTYQIILQRMVEITRREIKDRRARKIGSEEDYQQGAQYFQVPLQHLEASFVGRQHILQQIELSFLKKPVVHPVFVLHGNGGMGKSQIALQFARSHSQHFQNIVWIQSDTVKRMHESFRSISRHLGISDGISDEGTITKRVLTELLDGPENTLLVYDSLSADDTRLMEVIGSEHYPIWNQSRSSRVLITTRDRRFLNFETGGRHAAVEPLPSEEATKLLMDLSGAVSEDNVTRQSLYRICSALGCLPLAIRLAASYIKVTETHPHQFLDQLRQEPRSTLRHLDEFKSHMSPEKMIATVWEDSMAQIEAKDSFAATWFSLCSFLDNTIPHKLFEDARDYLLVSDNHEKETSVVQRQIQRLFAGASSIQSWNTARLYLDLLELKNLSMIKTNTYEDGCISSSIHPLVQHCGRMRLSSQQQKKYLSMASYLIHLCAEKMQHQHKARRDSILAYLHQRQLLSHAYSCISFASDVLKKNIAEIVPIECSVTFAMLLVHERCYDDSVRILEIATDEDGIDVLWNFRASRILALALRRQKKLVEALAVQEKALKKVNGLSPQADVTGERLRGRAELATIHRDLGHLKEALQLQKAVVEETELHFGPASVEALHELSCQARIHAKREEFQQAREIDERVLRIYKREYPHRVEIWNKMRNLAITYYDLGMYKDADTLEVEILEEKQKLYGLDHLETASALENLAMTRRYSGEHEQAYQLFRRALRVRKKILGELHEKVQNTARRLKEEESHVQKDSAIRPAENPMAETSFWNRRDSALGME